MQIRFNISEKFQKIKVDYPLCDMGILLPALSVRILTVSLPPSALNHGYSRG